MPQNEAIHPALVPLLRLLSSGPLTTKEEAVWSARLAEHPHRHTLAEMLAAVLIATGRRASLPEGERAELASVLMRLLFACLGNERAVSATLARVHKAEASAKQIAPPPNRRAQGLKAPKSAGSGLRPTKRPSKR
jgi:hypothetical protein